MADDYQPPGIDADGYQPPGYQPGGGSAPVDPCLVVFNLPEFRLRFPAFATVGDADLLNDFDGATLFLTNSCCSRVRNVDKRKKLLYYLTAHLAALFQGENGNPPPGFVGRVSQGTQGSVSVASQYASTMTMDQAFFAQTQYGVFFWGATAFLRTMHYVGPARCGPFNSWPWR